MGLFTKILSGGADKIIEAVGTAGDKLFTSDEERKSLDNEIKKAEMQYSTEMARLGLEETKAYLADTASARDNQSRVQESEHASWLAKNVHPILALGTVGLTFWMYYWIMEQDWDKLNESGIKDIILYILGALTTVSTQVVAYFFGSSHGSQDKTKALTAMAAKIEK